MSVGHEALESNVPVVEAEDSTREPEEPNFACLVWHFWLKANFPTHWLIVEVATNLYPFVGIEVFPKMS